TRAPVVTTPGPVLPMTRHDNARREPSGGKPPDPPATFSWNFFADPKKPTRQNFERARADLRALYQEFQPIGGLAFSPLSNTLDSFGRTARYQQTPLTVLLLEIAGIALFYVALISAVVVERQAGGDAPPPSRGAPVLHGPR